MKQKYIYLFLTLVLATGTAWGSFASYARAEGDHQNNSSGASVSGNAEFHFNKIGDNNGASDASEHSNATATMRLEDHNSQDQEREQENNNNGNGDNNQNSSSTESNDHGGSLGSNGIPTTLQGLLDFLQQLKEQVLALLARITGQNNSLAISSISANSITPSGATITWNTNQTASGKVYVSTSTPVIISTASSTSDATLALNHSVLINNLSASTTYYYVVESTNASGSIERSDTYSFTTAQTQNLSISGVNVAASSLTASSAIVQWTTNTSATSRVYVSTSTPVVTASATFTENQTLVLAHAITLSGLTASTTYYYIAESKDANGNIAQSSQGLFTTL